MPTASSAQAERRAAVTTAPRAHQYRRDIFLATSTNSVPATKTMKPMTMKSIMPQCTSLVTCMATKGISRTIQVARAIQTKTLFRMIRLLNVVLIESSPCRPTVELTCAAAEVELSDLSATYSSTDNICFRSAPHLRSSFQTEAPFGGIVVRLKPVRVRIVTIPLKTDQTSCTV